MNPFANDITPELILDMLKRHIWIALSLFILILTATVGFIGGECPVARRRGAARVLADPELDAGSLGDTLAALLADGVELARMGERARSLARPDAAAAIAERLGGLLEAAA